VVAGATFHQEALIKVANEWKAAQKSKQASLPRVTAHLIRDPKNREDRNAVRVEVGKYLVGHLKREDAAAYQPLLQALEARKQIAACNGVIRELAKGDTLFIKLEEFVHPSYRLN
jgi:hypothetical protein